MSWTVADFNANTDGDIGLSPMFGEEPSQSGRASSQDSRGEGEFLDTIPPTLLSCPVFNQEQSPSSGENTVSDTVLVQPSPLDHFGLAINVDIRVLTCTICCIGLVSNQWIGHMENKHKLAFVNSKKKYPTEYTQVQDTLAQFDLGDPLQVKCRRPGQAPVRGIEIRSGYCCPVPVNGTPCQHVTGTEASFTTHISTKHKGVATRSSLGDVKLYACDYQTIFEGSNRQYFLVQTGVALGPTVGPYEIFLSQNKSTIPHASQGGVELETHDLPSLLRVTHWDVFVGPFRKSPKDVVGLVDFPSHQDSPEENLLCLLHNVSKAWLKKVYTIWESSSPSVRRLLGMA